MKKHYGNEPTKLNLTDKAFKAYSNTDPLTVYEFEEDGEMRYDIIGAVEAYNLNESEVNELFESLLEEPEW